MTELLARDPGCSHPAPLRKHFAADTDLCTVCDTLIDADPTK